MKRKLIGTATGPAWESLSLGILLSMAGGFMDAYSYIHRGGVFAYAQTGNILLLGIRVSRGEWARAWSYLLPILAFVAGLLIANAARGSRVPRFSSWRTIILVAECVIFFGVGFIPQDGNAYANCLISLACGMQTESFGTIRGHSVATTMCVGNLRSAVNAFYGFWSTKNRQLAEKAALIGGIILSFVAGAVLGNTCIEWFAGRSIWLCDLFLLVGCAVLYTGENR